MEQHVRKELNNNNNDDHSISFKLLHLFHGLNQVNILLPIGRPKQPRHFLIHHLILNRHIPMEIFLLQQILLHLVKHIILRLHRKIFHMIHYLIHRINNTNNSNNITMYLQQRIIIHIIIGDMF